MNGRLKKRGMLALIIYFLMITAVSTPIAFMTGKARGADRARLDAAGADSLSQNETQTPDAPIALAMAPAMTPESNAAANNRPAGRGPAAERVVSNAAFGPRAPSLKPAALREAVLRAISNGPSGAAGGAATGEGETPSPFSLAMAPGLSPGSGGFTQGGAPNQAGGYPGAIIPGMFPVNGGDAPQLPETPITDNPDSPPPLVEDPNVIVTPVPAALPLMLTGLGGLFAFGRRARS